MNHFVALLPALLVTALPSDPPATFSGTAELAALWFDNTNQFQGRRVVFSGSLVLRRRGTKG